MTLDRKDYKSAIPQLEGRLEQIEKLGKDVFNKFEDIAHKTQLDAAEAEKKVAALDYQIDSINVVTEYQLQTTGLDPVEANWSTTMPSITYSSYNGKTLWCRSVTYQNDIAIRKTAPQIVQLMDGLYTFVNSASGNTGWTMIDGDFIQTGKIASTNGYSYFDIDNNSFQMKDASTVALSNSALAWQNGLLYVKGKIAVGSSETDQKYYTEMTGGGFDVVANNVTLAHIGYGAGKSESGTTTTAPYYDFGARESGSTIGNLSVAEGRNVTASGYCSHAQNYGTIASKTGQTVIGTYNVEDTSTHDYGALNGTGLYAFIVGNGNNVTRSNAFAVSWTGQLFTKQIQTGSISSDDVASGTIRTETVTFPQAMSGTPAVIACLQSSSQYAETGSVSVGVSSISSTGFTCKIFNNSSRQLSPAVQWIAVNVGLP